jgi:outer membrane protein OmpA-like peptidoglycan-associated protein
MFKRLAVVVIGVVAVLATGAAAQGQDAAARAALANARILDINGRILDIVGVTLGVDSVMKELGAKVTAQEIKIELSADVLFDFDKFDLKAQATDSLMKVAAVIKAYPKAPLLIEGHTDGKGAHAYNVSLSENRAATVKTWLVQNASVDPARIAVSGWGEAKPVAPNTLPNGADNPEGRQKNRRVEITLRTR